MKPAARLAALLAPWRASWPTLLGYAGGVATGFIAAFLLLDWALLEGATGMAVMVALVRFLHLA